MAEEVVVKEDLSQAMMRAGAQLTELLIGAGMVVSASLWLYDAEANAWRLLIASPEVRKRGPKEVYGQIRAAIAQMPQGQPGLELMDVSAVDERYATVSLLRHAVKTGENLAAIRFAGNAIRGHLIEDAYIYRML